MIKTYYKFDLTKEWLIATEQASATVSTHVCGCFVDIDEIPDISNTTIQCQNGWFIPKGFYMADFEWRTIKKKLDHFIIEKLRSEPLQWQYYDKFYIS